MGNTARQRNFQARPSWHANVERYNRVESYIECENVILCGQYVLNAEDIR